MECEEGAAVFGGPHEREAFVGRDPRRPSSTSLERATAEGSSNRRIADQLVAEKAEHVARTIPGARHVIIAGAGHFVNIEQPEAYTRVVLEWLREDLWAR